MDTTTTSAPTGLPLDLPQPQYATYRQTLHSLFNDAMRRSDISAQIKIIDLLTDPSRAMLLEQAFLTIAPKGDTI